MKHSFKTALLLILFGGSIGIAGTDGYLADAAHELEGIKPDIVLLGNSMLGRGIDKDIIEKQTNLKVLKTYVSGSATAIWYLYIKNVVLSAKDKPKTLVVFFRDYFLTIPDFRVGGKYRKTVKMLSIGIEAKLEKIAYKRTVSSAMKNMFIEIRPDLISDIKRLSFKLSRKILCFFNSQNCSDMIGDYKEVTKRIFNIQTYNIPIYSKLQFSVEKNHNNFNKDFSSAVQKSFLPTMIDLVKNKKIELIFVRVKRRNQEKISRSPELSKYILDLKKYLTEREVRLIDFTNNMEITPEHYADGDHLNSRGRIVFSSLLAKELQH